MPSLTFIKPGVYTSIQDQGRKGLAHYAIPRSGVMDQLAADQANTLVGNDLTQPVLEATLMAPTVRFNSEATIAITGAYMQWQLNGNQLASNKTLKINPGDILKGSASNEGVRSYIAIRGQLSCRRNFGSSSSYSYAQLGHNYGRRFTKGDELYWNEIDGKFLDIHIKPTARKMLFGILPGPEYHLLSDSSKKILVSADFIITPESNRMGAKLMGRQLEIKSGLKESVGILPGFIQLPKDGQPIVILQDGQTTGGYPRIAYMDKKELSLFNQHPFGMPFQFYLSE